MSKRNNRQKAIGERWIHGGPDGLVPPRWEKSQPKPPKASEAFWTPGEKKQ